MFQTTNQYCNYIISPWKWGNNVRGNKLAIESSPAAARDERHIHIAHEGPLGASREQGVALVVEVIFASAYHGKEA